MKLLPGSSGSKEFTLHFNNLQEFTLFFEVVDEQGFFDLSKSSLPPDGILIARIEGNTRTRRIKPLEIINNATSQRVIVAEPRAANVPSASSKPRAAGPQFSAPAAKEADTEEKNYTAADRIKAMTITEKSHLALKADFQERRALMQDNNPKIQEFLLRNPRMTEAEIAWMAKNPLSAVATLLTIMQNKTWMSLDSIRRGILTNPKTPPMHLHEMIPRLSSPDLMHIYQFSALREDLRAGVEREAKKRGVKLKPRS